jgi:ABC-type polysaccharide/polyol phosphate transport system ATPase subunit
MSTMLALAAGFHPELTGRENIYFNGAIMGLGASDLAGKIDKIIDFAELNDFIDSPVKTYSDGMLMRLGFSIAVETDPDILLIDEVLAVGDAEFQEKCYGRIDAFKHAGRTIVFVTHDLEAAKSVASRAVWLSAGEVRGDGDTVQVTAQYLDSLIHIGQDGGARVESGGG